MVAETKTIIPNENRKEALEVMEFMEEITAEEKKEFLIFIQGIQYARKMRIVQQA